MLWHTGQDRRLGRYAHLDARTGSLRFCMGSPLTRLDQAYGTILAHQSLKSNRLSFLGKKTH